MRNVKKWKCKTKLYLHDDDIAMIYFGSYYSKIAVPQKTLVLKITEKTLGKDQTPP